MRYSIYLQLPLIAFPRITVVPCLRIIILVPRTYTVIPPIVIQLLVYSKQGCTFAVCFLTGSDYESGEKMKTRDRALPVRRVDILESFLRSPDCFQRHRPIAPRIFQWECFWSITNLPIPFLYSPAVFFFWRDRRDVNDSAAKRGTVW